MSASEKGKRPEAWKWDRDARVIQRFFQMLANGVFDKPKPKVASNTPTAPRLILSANAVSDDPERVADYSCQWCDEPAVGYLFFGPQFCEEHKPEDLKRRERG